MNNLFEQLFNLFAKSSILRLHLCPTASIKLAKAVRSAKPKVAKKKSGRRLKPRVSKTGDLTELKRQIALIAKKHFYRFGYDGTSLRKVAHEAKVSNSLLNYYFGGKAGIFDYCLDQFINANQSLLADILKSPKSADELKVRLELLVKALTRASHEDYEMLQIIRREMNGNHIKRIEKFFNSLVKNSFQLTRQFFEEAQASQLIRKGLKPEYLAFMIFDICTNGYRKDHFVERLLIKPTSMDEFKNQMNDHVIELFLKGLTV